MLTVQGLEAGYGRARVLFGIDLAVAAGEILVLLGRNGAGKSTTLKAIMGLLAPSAGSIAFDGRRIDGLPPHRLARLGLGYVPEDRRVFAGLTVAENLDVGRQPPRAGTSPLDEPRIWRLFPRLAELSDRRAGEMSGGEQQMLTLARTLMGNPRCLLLDEPSEGLAPVVVEAIAAAVASLKRDGLAVLLSEQNLRFARRVADRAAIIEQGRIRFQGPMAALAADESLARAYLAV
jgi:branched-chain amino acid transport system ATP-binding protein